MVSDNQGFVTIPTFSNPSTVPLLKIEQPDLLTIIATATIGLLLWASLSLSPAVGGVLTAATTMLGIMYVVSAPSYINSWQWTSTLYAYFRKPNRYASTEEAAEYVNDAAFSTTKQTQELTNIKRFHPSKDVIEREDGSLVAIVEVNPPHRDFATDSDWFSTARSIAEWYNNAVNFEFQLYATTQPFPIETHLDTLENRLDDPDVLGNENLQLLIQERLEEKRSAYEDAGTEVAHFYLITAINETEVRAVSETDQSPLERLESIPIVDIFVNAYRYYYGGQADQSDVETRLEMSRKLQNRVMTVMSLSERLEDANLHRLRISDIVALQRQFWRPSEKDASSETMQPRSQPASVMAQPEEVSG